MQKLTLISFNLCPYVQRSVITLKEKSAAYDIEYVDLYTKPDWFLQLSPFGKVPLLKVGDKTIFESAVISEYLDETIEPRMHSEDALERAQHRAWIEVISACLVDTYKLMVAPTKDDSLIAINSLQDKFTKLTTALTNKKNSEGEFFSGNNFCLVDSAAAPMLQRLTWCEKITTLNIFDNHPEIAKWRDALLARQSVQASLLPNIDSIFIDYLQGKRSPTYTTDSSWLGTLAKK